MNKPATFHITVSGGGAAELAVSVRGPPGELPVRISGDVHSGFIAEFIPTVVGAHTINVEYNGFAVQVNVTSTYYPHVNMQNIYKIQYFRVRLLLLNHTIQQKLMLAQLRKAQSVELFSLLLMPVRLAKVILK